MEAIVKATFKAKDERQLKYILAKLKSAFGERNINALTPNYIHRYQIYVLDMDIKIPLALLRYDPDLNAFKPMKEVE